MDARIEISKNGNRVLVVFYNQRLKDWDQQIDLAERRLGVTGENIPIIAMPESGWLTKRLTAS